MKLSSVICVIHKVRVSIYQTKYRSQSAQFTFVSFVSVDFDFYSDIRIFFGGFTAAKIRRLIQIFGGGGLGV